MLPYWETEVLTCTGRFMLLIRDWEGKEERDLRITTFQDIKKPFFYETIFHMTNNA